MIFPVHLHLPAQCTNDDENLTYSMTAELISLLDDMNEWDIHRCRGGKCMLLNFQNGGHGQYSNVKDEPHEAIHPECG
jgi:hypothetical protein